MSVDSLGGGAAPSNLAAFIAAELANLAADAQTLQGRISTGDILQAVVLAPNGLTDLLDIAGLRVAAALPSTLLPGETITVKVTGFVDDRINLQILPNAVPAAKNAGASAPSGQREAAEPAVTPFAAAPRAQAAVAVSVAGAGGASAPDGPRTAQPESLLTRALQPIEARLATAHATAAPPLLEPAAASLPLTRAAITPTGVEVAAAVRPPIPLRATVAAPLPQRVTAQPARLLPEPADSAAPPPRGTLPPAGAGFAGAERPASEQPSSDRGAASSPPARAGLPAAGADSTAGLRSAIPPQMGVPASFPARASSNAQSLEPPASSEPAAADSAAAPNLEPPSAEPAAAVPPERITIPPVYARISAAIRSSLAPPSTVVAPLAEPASSAERPATVPSSAAYTDPASLLHAVHLPVTPSTLAAAKAALETPERLPHLLATLDGALAKGGGAQAATLRTIVAFLARLEPNSPVLATQIAAYVDQALTGREVKLAQLLAAHDARTPEALRPNPARSEAQPAATAPPASGGFNVPAASLQAPDGDARGETAAVGAERVVLRQAALEYDLKTQLQSLLATLGKGGAGESAPQTRALGAAVEGALTAITALQLGAATTLAANPDGLAFALPIALPSGFVQAHVRIDHTAPQAKNVALDGDNFHIAFVLETQHLGTVAIDVVTVGRSVTIGVKAEAELARGAFGGALAGLTQRLETLRYRVAKADAVVALPAPAVPAAAAGPPPAPPTNPVRLVDINA